MQIFRQINYFTEEIYSKLIWRKKSHGREFRVFQNFGVAEIKSRNSKNQRTKACLLISRNFRQNVTHDLGSNGYSYLPVCTIRLCKAISDLLTKLAPHCSHTNGLSPVCTRRCSSMLPFCEKAFPQKSHVYGLYPEWTLKWASKLARCVNLKLRKYL